MNNTYLDCNEDDEGITASIALASFGASDIPFVYLESFSVDNHFLSAMHFIVNNQYAIHRQLQKDISAYIDSVYKSQDRTFSLIKIYIFPDVADEFGFVFRWTGDPEHGIGVKLSVTSVIKIGSADVAFL